VAVINATDLSPIMEHTQVKEIRELVAPDNKISTRPVEISLKVAELPTTTPIEVNTRNGKLITTLKSVCFHFCVRFHLTAQGVHIHSLLWKLTDIENLWPGSFSVVGLDYICISFHTHLTNDYHRSWSSLFHVLIYCY
jgi:hypothetical protein